jgi:hypothetical protein
LSISFTDPSRQHRPMRSATPTVNPPESAHPLPLYTILWGTISITRGTVGSEPSPSAASHTKIDGKKEVFRVMCHRAWRAGPSQMGPVSEMFPQIRRRSFLRSVEKSKIVVVARFHRGDRARFTRSRAPRVIENNCPLALRTRLLGRAQQSHGSRSAGPRRRSRAPAQTPCAPLRDQDRARKGRCSWRSTRTR